MNRKRRIVFFFLFLLCIVALTYFNLNAYSGRIHIANVIFLLLFIVYHLTSDYPKSKIFLWVMGLFTLSSILSALNFYASERFTVYIYIIGLFFISGIFLIVNEIFKETRVVSVEVKKYIWPILLVVLADMLMLHKILSFLQEFQLDVQHLISSFGFTILKMFLLSAGLISYFASNFKSKKVNYLNVSLLAFFLSDIIDIANYLYFTYNPLVEGLFLQNMFDIVGYVMFYNYCTYSGRFSNATSSSEK